MGSSEKGGREAALGRGGGTYQETQYQEQEEAQYQEQEEAWYQE